MTPKRHVQAIRQWERGGTQVSLYSSPPLPTSICTTDRLGRIVTQTLTEQFTGIQPDQDVRMILPQVHLRKPCYDFSFL
jgi:DNA-binding LacI/PurR family transcriptional regulator